METNELIKLLRDENNCDVLDCIDDAADRLEQLQAENERLKSGGWISVKDRLPEEHDSMFSKFYNTNKWCNAMWKKLSDEVNVVLKYKDGTSKVATCKTHDGEWDMSSIFQAVVTHWQPLPAPPQDD